MSRPDARLRVVLIGYGSLASGVLGGLLKARDRCTVAGVLRWPTAQGQGDRHDIGERVFGAQVRDAGIRVFDATRANVRRFERELTEVRADVVLVAAWGEILGPRVLECGPRFVNCHPSMLPRHRGANPYFAAILAGDTYTGVSFHVMDTGVDTGPVLLQERVPILPDDTGGSLRERCARVAGSLVPRLMEMLAPAGVPPAIEQSNLGTASRCARLGNADGALRWSEPASRIRDRVRAVQPWLVPRTLAPTSLGRMRVRVRSASVLGPGSASADTPAGTVLSSRTDSLRVATVEAGVAVELEGAELELAGIRLPTMLSRLALPALVREGTRLVDPL